MPTWNGLNSLVHASLRSNLYNGEMNFYAFECEWESSFALKRRRKHWSDRSWCYSLNDDCSIGVSQKMTKYPLSEWWIKLCQDYINWCGLWNYALTILFVYYKKKILDTSEYKSVVQPIFYLSLDTALIECIDVRSFSQRSNYKLWLKKKNPAHRNSSRTNERKRRAYPKSKKWQQTTEWAE